MRLLSFDPYRTFHLPGVVALKPADSEGASMAVNLLGFPMIVKEPRSSMGNGVFLVRSWQELVQLAERVDVLYVQEVLPIDRDLRVVWVGDRIVTAYWHIGREGDFRNTVARGAQVSFGDIPPQALRVVEQTATVLGVDHAGFDVAMVGDHAMLLEFNVLFGNQALNTRGIRLEPVMLDYLLRRSQPPREPSSTQSAVG